MLRWVKVPLSNRLMMIRFTKKFLEMHRDNGISVIYCAELGY